MTDINSELSWFSDKIDNCVKEISKYEELDTVANELQYVSDRLIDLINGKL